MKKAVITLLLILATVILIGCKAKQSIVTENQTATLIDTTHTETDSMSTVSTTIVTDSSGQHVEGQALIEFVDGGGSVSIDTAGNVTINGIKSIKGKHRADSHQVKGVAKSDTMTASHTDQANGITKNEARQNHREEKASRAIRWYEKPLIWIGSLCCIAAILWLMFIYIHKKH